MPARYFTLEEANALLPELEPVMAELLARRAKVVRQRQNIAPILNDPHGDMGGSAATEMALDFVRITELIEQVQAFGCVLKDLNTGLLDFLSERDGREIYLCWRYGEPRIEYYHELHTGFTGRRRY